MKETESVSETLVCWNDLMWPSAQEDFIASTSRESFKTLKHHAMTWEGGTKILLYAFLNSPLIGGEWRESG